MRTSNTTEEKSMDPHLYNIISLITVSVTCVGNMLLSVPLMTAICRSPSLLGKARFHLLFHLLCCDNLQLLVRLTQTALLTSRFPLLVTHCVVFISANQFFFSVALLFRAGLSVDCCLAIRLPMRYETLLSPMRQRVAVVLVWASSLLVSMVSMGMMLERVRKDAALPLCTFHKMWPCLSDQGSLVIFFLAIIILIITLAFVTILCCFLMLCCHSHWRLCSQRKACVTLTIQAVQIVTHGVALVLMLCGPSMHNLHWDLVFWTIYVLAISLVSLVFGYRSKELRRRVCHQVCHKVNDSQ